MINVREILSKHTKHEKLIKWVEEVVALCEPKDIMFCDGSDEEFNKLVSDGVKEGRWLELKSRPNSILVRSSADDVARVEQLTFICSKDKKDAGPTNHWRAPEEMKKEMDGLYKGCMKGRTMYVIPFSMGPIGSKIAHIGVEISDSSYVVFNMKIMTRMGKKVIEQLGDNGEFIKCLHSVGKPILKPEDDLGWPSNSTKRITHFPEERTIKSFGSGYGGNALLGKKCFALRIASVMAREEGWLAEHMLILKMINPAGKIHYITAAFPSACGKTNLAMIDPPKEFKGWKVECVGDDIAWMKFNKEDGRLYAINPEAGFFGVCPGTSDESNKNALLTLRKNSIFTNVGMTDDGDVWWEGLTKEKPKHLIDWLGKDWTPESKTNAAHPNARFTTSLSQCPVASPDSDDPKGVPIDAMLFGGRRESVIPIVSESYNWDHGVFYGCALSSEITAAADVTQKIRHDPFAMLPFCGYHMGDYFNHWVKVGETHKGGKLPKIYMVNWFRKDEKGNFIWPGYSENFRALVWIFERLEGKTDNGVSTPWGTIPKPDSFNLNGLNIDKNLVAKTLLHVDNKLIQKEMEELREYFKIFGDQMPKKVLGVLEDIEKKCKQ